MKNIEYSHYEWVDTVKGIGILLVIAGHTFTGYIYHFIYLFHMPLFFFIAGFLHKTQDIPLFFKRKVYRLLKPYVFYLFLFTLLLIIGDMYHHTLNINVFFRLIARSLFGGVALTGWESVFWFVTVFIISQQILNFMLKSFSIKKCMLFNLFFLVSAYIDSMFFSLKTPFGLSMVLFTTPIMFIGYLYRMTIININWTVLMFFVLLAATLTYFYPNEMMLDIKHSKYGFFIFGFCLSILLSLQMITLCKLEVLQCGFFSFLGRYSLFIMFIHQFIKDVIWIPIFDDSSFIYLGTVLSCISICYLFDIIKKHELLSNKILVWILG